MLDRIFEGYKALLCLSMKTRR